MISPGTHAMLDAISAAALVAVPQALGWPHAVRRGCAAAAAGVAAYSALTAYRPGGGPLTLDEHLGLDGMQGAAFCAAAALLDEPTEVRAGLAGYGLFSIAAALLTEMPGGNARVGTQLPLPRAAVRAGSRGRARGIAPDIAYRRLGMVNVVFLGPPSAGDRGWVLVDAGLRGTGHLIDAAAAERFGASARPAGIVLTHGHFDHVGALERLADRWDAPIYAHPLEHPYLTGEAAYPPGDPGTGGGAMPPLARWFPTAPVDVSGRLHALPRDGGVPGAPGWRWLHTPGHSPGHVSLWREADRALVAGDAVITTRQESAYAIATQAPEMHGPPAYFTVEWDKAKESARLLAELAPELIITGHGRPLAGERMRAALRRLAVEFHALSVPRGGRYVRAPQRPGAGAYR